MDEQQAETLIRIEAEATAIAEVQRDQLRLARAMLERIDEILALLRPDEDGRDGVPLDEILAHLVAQGREIIKLLQTVTKIVTSMEKRLPPADLAAAGNGHDVRGDVRQ